MLGIFRVGGACRTSIWLVYRQSATVSPALARARMSVFLRQLLGRDHHPPKVRNSRMSDTSPVGDLDVSVANELASTRPMKDADIVHLLPT